MNFGNLLTKVLPYIGAAATGNVPALITMAAKEVSSVLGYDVPATAEDVGKAVANATPEQMIALRERELAFQERMQAMGFAHAEELARLGLQETQQQLADTADARKRDTGFIDAGKRNIRADLMVLLDVIGLVSCLIVLVFYKQEIPGEAVALIASIAATFGLCLRDAHSYEFGSSRSSQVKDATISNLSK